MNDDERLGKRATQRRAARILAGGLLPAFFAAAVLAADIDDEFEEKPPEAAEVQLPAFPESENLIPFRVGAVYDAQFFVDEKSISVGQDEEIRYSLVVVSRAGARNVSYEGMRCATGERRTYAFGRADGTWSNARNSRWRGIGGGSNSRHYALFADYFCAIGRPAIREPQDAIRVLRSGDRPAEP
jgi:hypothetical protein